MKDLADHKQMNCYPKMTALKSLKNILKQKMIRIIGLFLRRHAQRNEKDIYQKMVYRPVNEAEISSFKVNGEIPKHLHGLLLRIGSNPIYVKKPTLFEWYMGDGMVHGLKLQNGEAVWFKSKMIATDTVQKYKNQQCVQGYRRGAHDVINTNIFKHAGKLWAVIEAGAFPICMDYELNSERYQLFNSDADLPFTAHPRKDQKTGHLHAICYDALDRKNAYYQVIDEQGELIHVTQIPLQHGPMIHDCLITEQEVIVFDFPLTFSLTRLFTGKSVPYQWNEQHQARIGILAKYGQAEKIRWINVDPCFVFHAANAYRDNKNQIVLDVLVHQNDFEHSQHAAYEDQYGILERWTIDSSLNSIHRIVVDTGIQEFPKIDERYIGSPYRYLYTLGFPQDGLFNVLKIHDLVLQTCLNYDFGQQWAISEVTFVPEHSQSAEGQGHLMTYLHHIHGEASKVVILKVNGVETSVQAEIELGVRVPLGFHCNWINMKKKV
ncbi:carotenoid oxygenase family protein [Acinetobacter sp. VNH17]|uniref:Carotenoid oxygenase family protein n=1 Tax=Acinetobacter thutiue TaxID=2998078 RepID=A0ABT7WTS1_9GAMM|nr:carotenoid oxygenase family protein [Acinetobacter thutiue]MCY6413944.1 carotenoid oxygenase family protein [Acinetobacter thutiue]MDN0016053.1 carotenoid oxygenase family protein [Acinetobacter thutiue]